MGREGRGAYRAGPGSVFWHEKGESLLPTRVRELRWDRAPSRRREDASTTSREGDVANGSSGDSENKSVDFSDTEKLSLLGT